MVVRFLHLTARQVGEFDPPLADWPEGEEPPSRPVETLRVGDRLFQTWQEAEEREVALGAVALGDLLAARRHGRSRFPGGRRSEPLAGPDGDVVGVLIREQEPIAGSVEVVGGRGRGGASIA